MTNSTRNIIIVAVMIPLLVIVVLFSVSPDLRRVWNQWRFNVQVADDQTDYANLRRVEEQALASISTWEGAYRLWRQHKDSDVQEERNWANGAMTRANNTAATFNTMLLENSFLVDVLPERFREPLPFLPIEEDFLDN